MLGERRAIRAYDAYSSPNLTFLPLDFNGYSGKAVAIRGNAMKYLGAIIALAFVLRSIAAVATNYPAPKDGDWIARGFKFHTGEVMQEVNLHYLTVMHRRVVSLIVETLRHYP